MDQMPSLYSDEMTLNRIDLDFKDGIASRSEINVSERKIK